MAPSPLPMLIYCPRCGVQHVDDAQPERAWTNPPHRSHECQGCGLIFRPADFATTGVRSIATFGVRDTWRPGRRASHAACSHAARLVADLRTRLPASTSVVAVLSASARPTIRTLDAVCRLGAHDWRQVHVIDSRFYGLRETVRRISPEEAQGLLGGERLSA